MKFQSKARITALGGYVPKQKLTNNDLEAKVDTSDEWIVQRTGMHERRIAAKDEFVSHMAIKAIEDMVDRFSVDISDVDLVINASITPDYITPSVAAVVQGRTAIPGTAGVMDLNAACAGFVYALQVANAMVTSGHNKKVLVIAGEVLSKITDYSDRNTCILFGDGAGAALIEYDENNPGFLSSHYGSEGESGNKLYCTGLSKDIGEDGPKAIDHLYQDGRAVYTFVIRTVPTGVETLINNAGLKTTDINWFVPHSANLRMIHSISEKLGFQKEQALTSLEYYGNTSSATIPLALWIALKDGKLKKGDKLALYGFGGGLTHAGMIIEW